MRTLARLLPLVAAPLLLAGCLDIGDFVDSDAYREDFHSTHPLDAGGTVSVETFNGSIELRGWEQNSVEVNGTKSASSKGVLDALKIEVNATPGSVRIRAVRPPDFYRNMGVRFSIRVPRKALLDLVSTSNGRIQVEDVEGRARLHTSNGGIRVSRLKGELEARTSNGTIEAQDVDGNVNLHTSNGAIRAETTHGSFEGTTSNGSITARLNDPAATWPVRAESSNGHIDLTLDAKQLPEVRASTSNSSILLRLPASASARVRAGTSHSSITSDFDGLQSDADRRKHSELHGTIGSGGPLIDLQSSNGSIKIMKL
jgi:DUF4097 and DUF4098 domain-containing protein YvlB